jgi:hypothetical protein
MNPEVKQLWLKDLRSGKRKQGKDWLRTTMPDGSYRHCCLGVLCEIFTQQNPDVKFEDAKHYEPVGDMFLGEMKILPAEVAKWAGLKEADGGTISIGEGKSSTLPILNDNGVDFETLADHIENNL